MHPDEARLLRFCKLISIVGIVALIAPVFRMAAYFLAREYALFAMLSILPITLAQGYLWQWLWMGKRIRDAQQVDFHYEVDALSLPNSRKIPPMLLSAAVGLVIGFSTVHYWAKLAGLDANLFFGVPLYVVACMAAGVLGCWLCRMPFNVIMSVRSLVECAAIFAIYYAIGVFVVEKVDFLFVVCLALYVLCLMIAMSMEQILKAAHSSDTCHLTYKMVDASLYGAAQTWGRGILIGLCFISGATLLYIPVRSVMWNNMMQHVTDKEQLGSPFEAIFSSFPSQYAPLSLLFFIGGFILLIVGIVLLLGKGRSWRIYPFAQRIKHKISDFFRWVLRFRYRPKHVTEKKRGHADYTDTISTVRTVRHARTLNHAFFLRLLKDMETPHEQYCYAYRIWMDCMVRKNIGVESHHTPIEASKIILEKTVVSDMDHLTALFLRTAYANEDDRASDADLLAGIQRLSELLKREMEK